MCWGSGFRGKFSASREQAFPLAFVDDENIPGSG